MEAERLSDEQVAIMADPAYGTKPWHTHAERAAHALAREVQERREQEANSDIYVRAAMNDLHNLVRELLPERNGEPSFTVVEALVRQEAERTRRIPGTPETMFTQGPLRDAARAGAYAATGDAGLAERCKLAALSQLHEEYAVRPLVPREAPACPPPNPED